jgi:hypothetical protein
MKWIVAHHIEFSLEHARMVDEYNQVMKFDSQEEAMHHLYETGQEQEEIMIIPEMEFL